MSAGYVAVAGPPIILRESMKDDRGFILSTWALKAAENSGEASRAEKGAFHAYHFARAERLLDGGQAVVAAFDESPAYILGWIVFGRAIHYVFVRSEHRGQGIARTLLGAAGIDRLARTILGAR